MYSQHATEQDNDTVNKDNTEITPQHRQHSPPPKNEWRNTMINKQET